MAKYDIYHIEERLQQYDPDYFRRIDFDEKRGLHRLICYDPVNREEYVAFTVPAGKLDHRTVAKYMEIHPRNGFNIFKYLDQELNKREREQEKRISDMAHDLADNILSSFRMKVSRSID
jgi:hypothetical protein